MANAGQFSEAIWRRTPSIISQKPTDGSLKINGLSIAAVAMILFLISTALLVPVFPLQDPLATDYSQILQPPGSGHYLGTDLHGRDQLSRLLWAARSSLSVGIIATGLALATGVAIGGLAGYGGRHVDSICMRLTDIFLSFPVVLGAIAAMAVFGPGIRNIFLAIALFGWPIFARIFRSSVLSNKEKNYVKAAKVLGAGKLRIFFAHILPNSFGTVVSYSIMAVAGAILAEAGLSFINLGIQRPYPSWGLMLSESIGQMELAPWLVFAPGAAVTLTALTFILLSIALTRPGNTKFSSK